ncbi:SLC13 family permease [Lutibaculum baratangense]|uniref:Putative cation transporter protein n=1 Tax=Lutibaculum baratangense AMV1 TaxID=631454 RepID=V4R028_9HYPH|nr:SLC13 family permease [Lutibaculum baratangense]ESR25362.1 putative cation transporter protein [Lutibaculum baratangense AMV1]
MTFDQVAIVCLMTALLAVFAADRFRIEVVAIAGLAAGVALGLVPMGSAFSGFSSAAVITVAEILVIVQVLVRSHLLDLATDRIVRHVSSERGVVTTVCVMGAGISVLMNNIGALALLLPLSLSLCRSTGVRPGAVLLPLSFATLLGGTCSLIGTPANLLVSASRADTLGEPFSFFALAAIGLPVALVGLPVLVFLGPRLMRGRGLDAAAPAITGPRRFVTEFRVRPNSPLAGRSVAEVEDRLSGFVHAHLRNERHVFGRREEQEVRAGDVLLVETDVATAMEMYRRRAAEVTAGAAGGAGDWVEAVVLPQSTVLGSPARAIAAFEQAGIEVVALSPQTPRIEGRLGDVRFSVGDVLLLHGRPEAIGQALEDTDCLAISPRGVEQPKPQGWITLGVFLLAVALAAFGLVPPEIAFGGAILGLAAGGVIDLRRALPTLNWPVLMMLAAMIPLGAAVERTGAADVVATALMGLIGDAGPAGLHAVVLVAALVITPFINNASTAVALAPVAVALARSAGLPPDPLLMLVAVGVSLDFLTPFGHHNNTLVMGIGDYRFRDYPRLGLPLVAVAAVTAWAASLALA